MSGFLTIALKELRFYAQHGLYPEEKKTGNEFEINLVVSYSPSLQIVDDLHETVNYVSLYELLKKEMQQPRELLETLVMEIAEKIHHDFTLIKKIDITITKLQAPIAAFTGKVGVSYIKEY